MGIRHNVAVIHNDDERNALHHVAVGLAGHAQAGGARGYGDKGGGADIQSLLIILAVEVVQDSGVGKALLGDGLLQGLQLVAVTGKEEEHTVVLL